MRQAALFDCFFDILTPAYPFFSARLRRFPACLLLLVRPPVRHIAAVAAVELLGNVFLTSWAPTSIVLFGFHCLALTFNVCLRYRSHPCEVGNLDRLRPSAILISSSSFRFFSLDPMISLKIRA